VTKATKGEELTLTKEGLTPCEVYHGTKLTMDMIGATITARERSKNDLLITTPHGDGVVTTTVGTLLMDLVEDLGKYEEWRDQLRLEEAVTYTQEGWTVVRALDAEGLVEEDMIYGTQKRLAHVRSNVAVQKGAEEVSGSWVYGYTLAQVVEIAGFEVGIGERITAVVGIPGTRECEVMGEVEGDTVLGPWVEPYLVLTVEEARETREVMIAVDGVVRIVEMEEGEVITEQREAQFLSSDTMKMVYRGEEIEWKRQLGAWYVQGTRMHVMRKFKAGAGPQDLGGCDEEEREGEECTNRRRGIAGGVAALVMAISGGMEKLTGGGVTRFPIKS
jgi:hypothetical protein